MKFFLKVSLVLGLLCGIHANMLGMLKGGQRIGQSVIRKKMVQSGNQGAALVRVPTNSSLLSRLKSSEFCEPVRPSEHWNEAIWWKHIKKMHKRHSDKLGVIVPSYPCVPEDEIGWEKLWEVGTCLYLRDYEYAHKKVENNMYEANARIDDFMQRENFCAFKYSATIKFLYYQQEKYKSHRNMIEESRLRLPHIEALKQRSQEREEHIQKMAEKYDQWQEYLAQLNQSNGGEAHEFHQSNKHPLEMKEGGFLKYEVMRPRLDYSAISKDSVDEIREVGLQHIKGHENAVQYTEEKMYQVRQRTIPSSRFAEREYRIKSLEWQKKVAGDFFGQELS